MNGTLLFHVRNLAFLPLIGLLSGCAEISEVIRENYPSLDDFWGENVSEREIEPAKKPATVSIPTHHFPVNGRDSMVGQLATVPLLEGDTLLDIARHFGVGYQHIIEANPGVDIWVPQQDVRAALPLSFILPDAKPTGVVINLATMRLFHFRGGKQPSVSTWPIGIGREGRSTPLGMMAIARKMKHPTWYVPDSIRRTHAEQGDPLPAVVPPGPDNPLGEFALYLSRPSYLIHGTNKPFSIGLRASNGCIRLYPEDIERAYKEIPIGTPVNIVNQPYLLGWLNGILYLEAHEPYEEVDATAARKTLIGKLERMGRESPHRIDWRKVDGILKKPRGIPTPILENTPRLKDMLATAPQLERPARLFGQPEKAEPGKVGWFIRTEATDEYGAKKLAAQMNHFGPRIPAYIVATDRGYQVVGGPFAKQPAARKVQLDLANDFNTRSEIIKPARTEPATLVGAAPAVTKPGKPEPAKPATVDPGKPVKADAGKPVSSTQPKKYVKMEPGKSGWGIEPAKTIRILKSTVNSGTTKSAKPENSKPAVSAKPAMPAKTVEPPGPARRKPVPIILRLPKSNG